MYIRKAQREYKGKIYTNHLLVESAQTPQGPRQRTICSLGSLEPAPAEDWLGLAHKIQSALEGQASLSTVPTEVERLSRRALRGKKSTISVRILLLTHQSDGHHRANADSSLIRAVTTSSPSSVQVVQPGVHFSVTYFAVFRCKFSSLGHGGGSGSQGLRSSLAGIDQVLNWKSSPANNASPRPDGTFRAGKLDCPCRMAEFV